jgi:hypothetical protein
MVHDKTNRIPALATSETLVDLLGGRNRERRRFLMMKGAVTDEIGTPSFEFDKAPYDINDIDSVLDFLYGLLRYQSRFRCPRSVKIIDFNEP